MVGKKNDNSTGRNDYDDDGRKLTRTGAGPRVKRPRFAEVNPAGTQPHVTRDGQHCHAMAIR